MFGEMFISAQPITFPDLWESCVSDRKAGYRLEDDVMDTLMNPWGRHADLVMRPCVWMRPEPRFCPFTYGTSRLRRPSRKQVMVLSCPAGDASPSGGHQCEKRASDSSKTKDKVNNTPGSKGSVSVFNVTSEGSSSDVKDAAANTRSPAHTGEAPEERPWQFSVDMKGCDEVRATTEGGLLTVEGRGSSNTSHQMVRYTTSLPPHVSHDALSATLRNGRLTVTQRIAPQLEGQVRRLPIDVEHTQQQEEQPQQEQHQSDSNEQLQDMTNDESVQQQQQQQQQEGA